MQKETKLLHLKIMCHLLTAFQKSIVYKLIMQKTYVEMPIYNLLECSKNDKKTTGSLWNYYRDEQKDPLSSNSEPFKYKTSITGNILLMVKLAMKKTKLVNMKLKMLFH